MPKDTPSPTPDSNGNEVPVSVPAPTLQNGSGMQNNRRMEIFSSKVFSLIIGSCYMILIEFC